jgi:hypothetical protein
VTVTCTPRTPSYTDRILTHSLPGRQGGLTWGHYDAVDCVTLSDHRPIAAALTLRLDRSVRVKAEQEEDESSEAVFLEGNGLRGLMSEQDAVIVHVTLAHLRVDVLRGGEGARKAVASSLSAAPSTAATGGGGAGVGIGAGGAEVVGEAKEVTVAFPLVSEDELAFLRKAAALDEVSSERVKKQESGPSLCLHHPSKAETPSAHPAHCHKLIHLPFLTLAFPSFPSAPLFTLLPLSLFVSSRSHCSACR